MKSLLSFLCLCSLMLLFSCKDEQHDGVSPTQKLQFTLAADSFSDSDGRITQDLPEGTMLLVTLEDEAGDAILTRHAVNIIKMGDSYISDPVELRKGKYVLTEFMLADETELYYATPQRGSALSGLVTRPLPYTFVIAKDRVNNLQMQVVATGSNAPEDFGYVSFNIGLIHPMSVVVFAMQDNQWKLISAKAYILEGSTIKQSFDISSRVNQLPFALKTDASYTLRVIADGYDEYVSNFVYKDLIAALNGYPWRIYLGKRIVLRFAGSNHPETAEAETISLEIKGTGSVVLHWGPGDVETVTLPHTSNREYLASNFAEELQIRGALATITEFNVHNSYDLHVNYISGVKYLVGLKKFSVFFGTNIGAPLDFSNANELESVHLPYVELSNGLSIPSVSNLSDVRIWYKNEPSTGDVSAIIERVYNNAVNRSIFNGTFHLEDVPALAADAAAQLQSLRDDHGWVVSVNGEDI